MKTRIMALGTTAGLLLAAGLASAGPITPQNGDVIFASGTLGKVGIVQTPGSPVDLYNFPVPEDVRLAQITFGPNGRLFVNDGFGTFPEAADSKLWEINNPFSGAASSTIIAQGGILQTPIGLAWDPSRNAFFAVTNPGNSNPNPPEQTEGVIKVGLDGSLEQLYKENITGVPLPRYQSGVRITELPWTTDFLVVALNGGTLTGSGEPNTNASSVLHRFKPDGATNDDRMEIVLDLGGAEVQAALGLQLALSQGVTGRALSNGKSQIWVSDRTHGVFSIILDANGDFESIAPVAPELTGIDAGEIKYDRYNNDLVFGYGALPGSGFDSIARWDLDGVDGLSIIAENQFIRGLTIVPAPGALALIGLGGLAATRRRRR
ncbi:MAG: PEP-CTERM sorting domain-containing protein [Phycisphaerales bacterium]